MSSGKTLKLGLHKWESDDYVLREEFNDNFASIDKHAEEVTSQLAQKVAKETGKGLSTNDYNNTEKAEVAKVKNKADTTYVDQQIGNLGTLRVIGYYDTVSALQTAYPTGTSGVAVVMADGFGYYWNGSAWTKGTQFQSTGIADKSVGMKQTKYLMPEGLPSKNLFDKTTVTTGKQVNYTNGNIDNNSATAASDYINVSPSLQYILAKYSSGSDLAFYDSNKIFISGIGSAVGSFTTPSNCAYVRVTTRLENLDIQQLELGNTRTEYVNAYPKTQLYDNQVKTSNLQNKSVTNDKLADNSVGTTNYIEKSITPDKMSYLVAEGKASRNLFDKTKVTKGKYVDYTTGNLVNASAYNASDYIEVVEGEDYIISGYTQQQFAWYDSNKVYVSGNNIWINESSRTVPIGVKYVRLTIRDNYLDTMQFELGKAKTSYTSSYPKAIIDPESLNIKETVITVRKDGTGDFTNIPDALNSITDNSFIKPYVLLIGEGEFTEKNWHMKPYVSLEGVSPKKSWLKGENPETATDNETSQTQTFWWNVTGCYIKNLKITAKNMRYPIHADAGAFGNKNGKLKIFNCHIEHYGNQEVINYRANNDLPAGSPWMVWTPLGLGTSSGMEVIADNTNFTSNFYFHTNGDFERACYIQLNNCKMDKVTIQCMGSQQNDVIEINGCTINGDIIYESPQWLSTIPAVNKAEVSVRGHGNVKGQFINRISGSGSEYLPEFTGI